MREIPFFVTEYRSANPSRAKRYRAIVVREPESIFIGRQALFSPVVVQREFGSMFVENAVDDFYVIYLDQKLHPIGMMAFPEEAFTGSFERFTLAARELFRTAILLNCASFVCVRWKVAGVKDSAMDRTVATERLQATGTMVGIPLTDYIIMSNEFTEFGRWLSFNERGWL